MSTPATLRVALLAERLLDCMMDGREGGYVGVKRNAVLVPTSDYERLKNMIKVWGANQKGTAIGDNILVLGVYSVNGYLLLEFKKRTGGKVFTLHLQEDNPSQCFKLSYGVNLGIVVRSVERLRFYMKQIIRSE